VSRLTQIRQHLEKPQDTRVTVRLARMGHVIPLKRCILTNIYDEMI
jgi:hypothetical protein